MAELLTIAGLDDSHVDLLDALGIKSVESLLARGATASGRSRIAKAIGADEKTILCWVKLSDLFRIRGIRDEHIGLLVEAGVNSVSELAECDPDTLIATMMAENAEKEFVLQVPSTRQMADWVRQAKALPPVIDRSPKATTLTKREE